MIFARQFLGALVSNNPAYRHGLNLGAESRADKWKFSDNFARVFFLHSSGLASCQKLPTWIYSGVRKKCISTMPATIQSFVVSHQGKARGLLAVFMVGLPLLLFWSLYLQPPNADDYLPTGWLERFIKSVFAIILSVTFAGGLYFSLVRRVVTLDLESRYIVTESTLFGFLLQRKHWLLDEFRAIELKHVSAGDTADGYFSQIGLKHGSGKILWLRAFDTPSKVPTPEVLTFIAELEKTTKLPWGTSAL